MAFGGFAKGVVSAPTAEINMVPLIDVMLVLLVIFIVTAPLLTHAVKVDLPQVTSQPNPARPDHIQLAIHASGELFWNGDPVAPAGIAPRLQEAAARNPQPELHLRADRTTEYQHVARILGLAARAGLAKVGFVSEPEAHPR